MAYGSLIDIHSHNKAARFATVIVSVDASDFVVGEPRDGFYSLGIHPWFIGRQDIAASLRKMRSVSTDANLLAVGECGLDRLNDVPFAEQEAVFIAQIELAERLSKPVVIHCVRAFNELLSIKAALKPEQTWIFHGFNNKASIAASLLNCGGYLSFGKALLHPGSNAAKVLPAVPPDRFFLETDDSGLPIERIYEAAADLRSIGLPELQRTIANNFKRVFLHE